METLHDLGNDKMPFYKGTFVIETMFYLYLIKKYKSNCPVGFLRDDISLKKHNLKVLNALVKCIKSDNKVIIIPVTNNRHANMLIYRKQLNQIEHFEPHGSNSNLSRFVFNVVKLLNKLLIKNTLPTITLIPSNNVCSRIKGLQTIEDSLTKKYRTEGEGYCVAWSMFFAELCLKNPEIPSSELMQLIFDKLDTMSENEQSTYLRNIIRGYAIILNTKICKYFSELYGTNFGVRDLISSYNSNSTSFSYALSAFVEIELEYTLDPLMSDKKLMEIMSKNFVSNMHLQKFKNMHFQEMSPSSSQSKSKSSTRSKSSQSKSKSSTQKIKS